MEDLDKQFQMIKEVSGRLEELNTTIYIGLVHRSDLLQTIGYQYERWHLLVKREKSIYHTLNMLSIAVTKKCLVAEGWCLVFSTNQIQNALQQATIDSNSQIGAIFHVLQTKASSPTYFHKNKFTSAFQEIVDAYRVAKYQEANPGVYTILHSLSFLLLCLVIGAMVCACCWRHFISLSRKRNFPVRSLEAS